MRQIISDSRWNVFEKGCIQAASAGAGVTRVSCACPFFPGDKWTQFSVHLGIPLRTVEDWEAGRRKPPEYIPRLIEYQLKYEALVRSMKKGQYDAER